MNDTPNVIPDAKTLDGVNIHLGFISDSIRDMKQTIKETNNKLDTLQNQYITTTDFNEHLKADADHETRIRLIEQNMWKNVGISSIISATVTLIGSSLIVYFIK